MMETRYHDVVVYSVTNFCLFLLYVFKIGGMKLSSDVVFSVLQLCHSDYISDIPILYLGRAFI
jgi:hypothetical protein